MSEKVRYLVVVDDEGKIKGSIEHSELAREYFIVVEKQRKDAVDKANQLLELNEHLKEMTLVDHLTGLGNRRAMDVDLKHTHGAALRYGRPYSILLLDIDSFKLYNDKYGHAAGDEALKQIADLLSGSIRATDRIYRYGGEEILIILPETGIRGANVLAERLVMFVSDQHIVHSESPYKHLTVSCGIGSEESAGGKSKNSASILKQADEGLYKAKGEGKNRVGCLPYL